MNIEEIVARIRQTESRSKRKLLDEAADAIEELAKTSIVKRIPCEVDPRKEYVELDGIRLVCEEGQLVGWYRPGDGLVIDANAPTVDAVEAVRCWECKHHYWEQEPCHGKTVHYCELPHMRGVEVFKEFFCYYGDPKEGADNVH